MARRAVKKPPKVLVAEVINSDCLEYLKGLPGNSVDMVFTSPPYADRRKEAYGGKHASEYVEWFVPIGTEILRVLKHTGSFFLNIKPHTDRGERDLYVFDLVCALKREVGFRFIDEYCWTKNGFPGKFKGRFKNAFEPVYHFSKSDPAVLTFNPVACGTKMKEESIARTYRKQCGTPANGSKMTGMNTTNIRHLEFARPSNVLHVNNVSNQFSEKQHHPATFPEGLVDFFVKSFSNEGDLVLDCFGGSGTTGVVCSKLNRSFILVDNVLEYCELAASRINNIT